MARFMNYHIAVRLLKSIRTNVSFFRPDPTLASLRLEREDIDKERSIRLTEIINHLENEETNGDYMGAAMLLDKFKSMYWVEGNPSVTLALDSIRTWLLAFYEFQNG